jgi:cytochrome c6
MNKGVLLTVAALTLTTFAGTALAEKEKKGEALFKEKCAMCHPDGGNAMKADKTLKKKDMEKYGLKKKADIVKYLRKPGPGMPAFDEKALPKKDAEELAEYIQKAFK